MGKTLRLSILIILCALYACTDSGPTSFDTELQSIDEAREFLSGQEETGNLLTGIELIGRNGYYHLTYEDGTVARIPNTLLLSIDEDRERWQATFLFYDASSLQVPLLGDGLPVSDSDIRVNPYGYAPLTALITVEMPVEGSFSVTVMGRGTDGIAISNEFESFATTHEIPVLGLYPNYDNRVVLTFRNREGMERASETFILRTPVIPLSPNIDILNNTLPPDDDGIYFVTEMLGGFDQRGDIRWVYTGPGQYVYRKMANGNLIITSSKNIVSYHPDTFMEVTMLGKTVKSYHVPNRIHHEIRQMPTGNFLVASNSNPYEGNGNDGLTEEGTVFEIDRNTGAIVKTWDFNQILDTDRVRPESGNPDDLLHINSVYYDETDDTIVVSSKHQSTVVKVDYETGAIIWLLAHPEGWGEAWAPYVLDPVNADGSPADLAATDFYQYFQHAPMRLPNGNIMLYDNGNFRNFYGGGAIDSYSRAVEYEIDEIAHTVKKVWEFNYGKQLFTVATGDVDLLDNGNRLIGFLWQSGKTPKIVELDPSDQIIFEADLNRGESFYYRCEKVDLYSGI